MSPLSTTAQAVLATADADHVVTLPERLPIAAQRAVVQSLIKAGLLEEAPAGEGQPIWRTTERRRAACPACDGGGSGGGR